MARLARALHALGVALEVAGGWVGAASRWLEGWGDVLRRGGQVTNRAHLLLPSARREGDGCDAYQPGQPGEGDCMTDGHYLCAGCSRMCHDTAVERGLIACTDDEHEHVELI